MGRITHKKTPLTSKIYFVTGKKMKRNSEGFNSINSRYVIANLIQSSRNLRLKMSQKALSEILAAILKIKYGENTILILRYARTDWFLHSFPMLTNFCL